MNNHEEFVTYQQALKLKRLSFDWKCQRYYTKENAADDEVWLTTASYSPENWNNGRNKEPDFLKPLCSAPTQAVAMRWLREKHGIHIQVDASTNSYWTYVSKITMQNRTKPIDAFRSYEEAVSAGIDVALEQINEISE